MRHGPLRRYREPAYPTAEELREHPELLERLPSRWARHGAASVLTIALGVNGCRSAGPARVESTGPERASSFAAPAPDADADGGVAADAGVEDVAVQEGEGSAPPASAASGASAAPVSGAALSFDVGRGRGSVGCVVIAPPVFLTEDEAWDVIRAELSAVGISPRREFPGIGGLTMPSYGIERPVELDLDGGDGDRHVAFEFLSRPDLDDLERVGVSQAIPGRPRFISSVHTYQFLEAAREMAQQLGTPESLVVGVFYDPSTCFTYGSFGGPDLGCESSEPEARAKSLEDLRAQVRQFVDFLRSNGVI